MDTQPQVPELQCMTCGKPVSPTAGYFSTFLAGKRADFHVPCKPNFHFNKVIYEAPIAEATKIG